MSDDEEGPKSLEESILHSIDKAAASVQAPAQQAIHSVFILRWFVIALAFYAALVAAACTYSLYKVQEQANNNTKYLITSCSSGNVSRGLEKSLWDTLFFESAKLSKIKGEPVTKEEQRAIDRITAKVVLAYPQLDCSQVGAGNRVVIVPSPGGKK